MPAINFKKQFAELVESEEKRQTIRPLRKCPIKPGETLLLYTGMRTKQCRKLKEVVCKNVSPIVVGPRWIRLNGEVLEDEEMFKMARRDGFRRTLDFFNFFRKQYSLPFHGVLIQW